MKATIKVTSLIVLVAAAIFAATVGAVSDARADDDPPPPPGGGSWGMATPTPEPNNNPQIAIPDCMKTVLGCRVPISQLGDLQLAPTPTPTPEPPSTPTPTPDINNPGNSSGSNNPAGSGDQVNSGNPAGPGDQVNSGNTDGSSNVAGSGNAGDPDDSADPSLPNAGTGTASTSDGGQSGLIMIVLIIAGFAVALALFFTAWRMGRSER
jgi:hypothetical protein